MTFTVKIALQPFEIAFEAGSIAEAVAILQEPDNELSKLAALATGVAVAESQDEAPVVATETAPAKRTRKSKNQPDPATAVAPPPLAVPVPEAALTAPAAPVAVAPPPPPPPAPVAPAAPPVAGPLSQRVIRIVETIRDKVTGSPDGGAAYLSWLANPALGITDGDTVEKRLVNWVATTGAIMKATDKDGPTFQELIDALAFTPDDRLVAINSVSADLARALSLT